MGTRVLRKGGASLGPRGSEEAVPCPVAYFRDFTDCRLGRDSVVFTLAAS